MRAQVINVGHEAEDGDDVFVGACVVDVGHEAVNGGDVLAGTRVIDMSRKVMDEGCDDVDEGREVVNKEDVPVDAIIRPLVASP